MKEQPNNEVQEQVEEQNEEQVEEQNEEQGAEPQKKRAVKPIFEVDGLITVEVPEGYEFGKFQSLKKKQFADEVNYMLFKAAEFQWRADKFREQAEETKKLGGAKQRAKMKKLVKMREQYAALQESLKAQGIDVDSLLSGD